MTLFEFDQLSLRAALSDLSARQRAAFAAACAEVLVAAYGRYCTLEDAGDPAFVRRVMDSVWLNLESVQFGQQDPGLPTPDTLMALMPDEEDWNEWAPQAEDAIAALVMLLDLLESGDPTLAERIATRPYAAADELSARQLDVAFVDSAERQRLLESPIVQRELQRQEDALAMLRESADGDPSVLLELRQAAQEFSVGGL